MKHVLPAIIAVVLLVGCKDSMDTNYQPKKLGVTPEERRGYYAPAFSPEAAAAGEGSQNLSRSRRPY